MLASSLRWTIVLGIFGLATLAQGQLIVAHRGASYDAPENTLAAFRLAWQRGADGVEGDFYLSSDGQVVCIHDKDTKRVSDQNLVVERTSFKKLRTLDVGAWKDEKWRGERSPTLEEVLATVPSQGMLFIELKMGPKIVEPVIGIITASKVRLEKIVIISFDSETIAACERRMPELRTHWLTGYEKSDAGRWQPSAATVAETIERIGADGLGSNALLEFVDKAFLDQYRSVGPDDFHVWTVNDLSTARRYQALGAWSITTDRPGWLRSALKAP
jgi:glycerophosphoryl diester phosphodiesterase